MSKYKCVIFDCDGVLIDSESIAVGTMVDMANELGANIEKEGAVERFKGKSFSTCLEMISNQIGSPLPDTFEADYRVKTFEVFKRDIQPIEGIKDVVEHLKVPFCTASSGPENKIRLNLGLTGLLPFFEDHIFSCYTIGKWKPDPAVFLWAAETMGFKPNECVVVEDSLSGVRAAKRGGFDVFGYTAHDYHNELEAEATQVFNHMPELLEMI